MELSVVHFIEQIFDEQLQQHAHEYLSFIKIVTAL